MPFGLTLAQLLDLSNEVPGLVADVKKAEPKLTPLLNQAATLLESAELQATIANVDAILQNKKLVADLSTLLGKVKDAAPTLAPIVKKAAAMLHAIATTDTPEAASAKIKRMPLDLAGGADRGG